ncbi:NADH:flavin oxidoreductase [Brenneria rubrifaciens]|uniref:NADH:flavin oxidoreductase n=1 Tax=Brenneria rubrifaciens TaxID=55213 RepID=A0A4P8QMY7_9GAMM|nr:NADH:flavin oxidoreductase [Brenneria rubrifaciens]QCR07676.1 NADH:flavin oxidoreductase [Brenneria rubrifaciens]
MPDYFSLKQPISFGKNIFASNRMYFSSIGFDLCDSMGKPLPEFFEIYNSIMEGGCGFGFLGNASVDPQSQYTDRSMKLVSEDHANDLLPAFLSAKEKGVLLGVQLQHYGVKVNGNITASDQTTSSAVSGDVTFLSNDQIEGYIKQFYNAALQALRIGVPALQIHAANGYLLSSFLSPRTNRRNDQWGGSPIKRAKILLEVIRRIRTLVGEQMAIFVRLQIDDGLSKEGIHIDMLSDVIIAIEEAGADAVIGATGIAETYAKFLGDKTYTINKSREAGRFFKQRTSIPIGFAANIDSLTLADEIVDSGDADFVGFGRAIVADHHFVSKELSGRSHEIHRCRWDSYCLLDKKEPLADRVFCCVNPRYLRPQHIQKKHQEK